MSGITKELLEQVKASLKIMDERITSIENKIDNNHNEMLYALKENSKK